MAKIYLNGIDMTFEYGFNITEHYNQTLDTGKIIFPHTGKLAIEPMDDVVITDGAYIKNMVVSYYKAVVANYGTPNTYNYEVELVSHTIKLQRILLPNRSITQPLEGTKKTIWDVISHYLELYMPNYSVLETAELQAFTETTDAPEMAWNNPTLFEVLNDLLSVLKAVVTMPNSVTISYLRRDVVGSEIPASSYYNIEYAQSTETYAHTLQSELKNVYVDYVNYRSQRITPRTVGSPVLNTNNVSLILDKPIGFITNVILSVVTTEQVDEVEGVPVFDDIRYDTDITSHVVPKPVYDLAYVSNSSSAVSGNFKRDLIYYTEGSNTIDGLAYSDDTWFSGLGSPTAIDNIFYNEEGKSLAVLLSDFWDDISFYVEYITAEDVKFDTDRDETVKHDSVMPNAQTTSYVDLLAFSKNNKQLVNSMSTDDSIIYGRLDAVSDVPELSDYVDDYLLSQRTIVFEDGFVEYTGKLNKNYFSMISYTGINAERRFQSIASASDALLSHHLNKLYFQITKDEVVSALPLLEYLWSVGISDMQIGLVTFDTDVAVAYGIIGSAHYTVDSILYSIRMEDNYNVAISQDDGGVKINQVYTAYVDTEGEFESFVAKFYVGEQNTDMASTDRTTYLAALDKARALPKLLFTPDEADLIYETDITKRYKDDREITAETWQFTIKGDTGIYITPKFFRDSAFFGNPRSLKVLYSTTHTYDRFSTEAVGVDASATISVVGNKLSITSAVTGATSWALTTVAGETYIMVNGDICDLYMKFLDGKTYLSGIASASLVITGTASGWKSTDYVGGADGSMTMVGSATGYKSTDYIGSADGVITILGVANGWKSTDLFGAASGIITMSGEADGFMTEMTVHEGAADGVITMSGSATGNVNATYWQVTFLNHDASVLKVEQVLNGGDATPPSNPTRTGYTFTGWGGDYTGVIQDEVIVATYTANPYTVYFNANGGNTPNPTSKSVTYNSLYGTLATTTRTGYTFAGWFTASSGGTQVTSETTVTVTNNHTLYARWSSNTYTVTFKDYDGTTLKSQSTSYGGSVTPPSNPTRQGYTFTGWDNSSYTYVESDLTITAQYTQNTYTVTFSENGGSTVSNQTIEHGSTASSPTTTRSGYIFNGWYSDSGLTTLFNFSTAITSNITLYAGWTQTFTVTFKDVDNKVLKTETVAQGSDATPPSNPTITGYTFTGWSGTYTNVNGDEVVFATYTASTYTVTFNENGGSTVSNKTVTFDSTYGTLTTPTQSGWTFLGWYTSTSYTTQVTSGTVVTTANNHTLYAHWVSYGWESGGSSPVGSNSCSSSNDEGNVRCNLEVISCSWEQKGLIYPSTTDVSVNKTASCMDAETRTVCTLISAPSYDWVAGGSAITPNQLCLTANHVGNVRGEVVSCSWGDIINTYFSTIDRTTSNPDCYRDETRTICTNVGPNWLCEVRLANRTYGNFETCTLISQAEYTCVQYEAEREYGYTNCEVCEVTYK